MFVSIFDLYDIGDPGRVPRRYMGCPELIPVLEALDGEANQILAQAPVHRIHQPHDCFVPPPIQAIEDPTLSLALGYQVEGHDADLEIVELRFENDTQRL